MKDMVHKLRVWKDLNLLAGQTALHWSSHRHIFMQARNKQLPHWCVFASFKTMCACVYTCVACKEYNILFLHYSCDFKYTFCWSCKAWHTHLCPWATDYHAIEMTCCCCYNHYLQDTCNTNKRLTNDRMTDYSPQSGYHSECVWWSRAGLAWRK